MSNAVGMFLRQIVLQKGIPFEMKLVFYLPDETSATVSIIRIMYGGRDINKQLNDN